MPPLCRWYSHYPYQGGHFLIMEYNRNNPLKVITLCSGYDSQCLALNRLKEVYPEFDYELVAWSEFDPESKAPLEKQPAVIAHNALFPQWKDRNLGDMTKINWGGAELEMRPAFLFYALSVDFASRFATRLCRG